MDISKELSKINKDDLKRLTSKSDFWGLYSFAINWLLIVGSFALVAWKPTWYTILVALIILGGRILGLAILMHDCSHSALFKTPWLNTFLGKWFCAAPIMADLDGYRTYHLKHHSAAGTVDDPDRSNYKPYPVPRASLVRKFFRDLSGITGLKTLLIVYKMNSGQIAYQLSYDQVKLEEKPFYVTFTTAMKNLFPNILMNVLMFGTCYLLGRPFLYLLWPVAWMTTYMLFSRIRNAAEHASTPNIDDLDPRMNTRTTYANPLERLTVAPNHVNYHLEHHILASVPSYHLKEFHHKLKDAGVLTGADISKNYLEVISKLVAA